MRILAFTPTRASTPHRAKLLQDTIVEARKTAGCAFDWHVYASGCAEVGLTVLRAAETTAQIALTVYKENVGQHIIWNIAYKKALDEGYDYLLRIDDDCEFKTKRWLDKLIKASVTLDDKFILSPVVRGLINPPEKSQPCEVKGLTLEFLTHAIGGICRLHPVKLLQEHEFVADVRKPLGSGDATGIADWCREHVIPMAYLKHVRVKHARTTRGQEEQDSQHFSSHAIFQHIPYIPPWRANA